MCWGAVGVMFVCVRRWGSGRGGCVCSCICVCVSLRGSAWSFMDLCWKTAHFVSILNLLLSISLSNSFNCSVERKRFTFPTRHLTYSFRSISPQIQDTTSLPLITWLGLLVNLPLPQRKLRVAVGMRILVADLENLRQRYHGRAWVWGRGTWAFWSTCCCSCLLVFVSFITYSFFALMREQYLTTYNKVIDTSTSYLIDLQYTFYRVNNTF